MLPVKKSNFLAATLKREKAAKQRKAGSEGDGEGRMKRENKWKERDGTRGEGRRDGGSRGW